MPNTASTVVGSDGKSYLSGNVAKGANAQNAMKDVDQQSDQAPGDDSKSCGKSQGQAPQDDYAAVGNAFQAFSKMLQPAIQAMNNLTRLMPRFPVTGISDAIHSQPIQAAAKIEGRIQAVETGMVKNTPGGAVGAGIATAFPPARVPLALLGAANIANQVANVDPNNRDASINKAIENSAFPFFPGSGRPQPGRFDASAAAREPLAGVVERGVNLPPAGTAAKAAMADPSILGNVPAPPLRGITPALDGGKYAGQNLRMPGIMRVYDQQRNVQIFTPIELANYRVTAGPNGELMYANSGQRLVSNGEYIYVMDQNGNMFAARAQEGVIHHSSLAGPNANPIAGGHLVTDGRGRLIGLDENTGHFGGSQPPGRSDIVRAELGQQGIDISHTITVPFEK